jgi:hypothetical protein
MAVTAEDGERGFLVKYEETILYIHSVTYFMAVMCETLGKIDEGSIQHTVTYVHRLNMEVDLQSLFGFHVT